MDVMDAVEKKTTVEERRKEVTEFFATHDLGRGLGTRKTPCTIAAINLALTGMLTDEIPDCMSEVAGIWVISIQDAMPLDMLNGSEWKRWAPELEGTGREHEAERLSIILDWMWDTVLPELQPMADAHGFGVEWRTMCVDRDQSATVKAAKAAWAPSEEEEEEWASSAAWAEWAPSVAWAAEAAWAAWAAVARARAASARAASAVAEAAVAVDWAANTAEYWRRIDPSDVLRRLVDVANTSGELGRE